MRRIPSLDSPALRGLLAWAVLATAGACSRYAVLPPPAPLPQQVQGGLSAEDQARLAEARKAQGPAGQEVLDHTLESLANDPRLQRTDTDAALHRALAGFGRDENFCDRLARELAPITLRGPVAQGPERVALAVSIEQAWREWLSSAGRSRYADPPALARAIRDHALAPGDLDPQAPLAPLDRPMLVTDAADLEQLGVAAAEVMCLTGPATPSHVVAVIPASALSAPLHVPTAADAVCRARFVVPPADATTGRTCSGHPEYATAPLRVGAASELRLTR
jgi:hypothetical protein